MATMTGKQLLAKLADAGSGESKLKACANAMTGDSAMDVIRTLKSLGYQSTAEKAAGILAAEGIAVPGLEVSADAALRSALEESKAVNAKLVAEVRELKAALNESKATIADLQAESDKKTASAGTGKATK